MLEGEWSVQPLDLATVFPNTDANIKSYCTRYRPGSNTLIATDSDDRPLRAVLEYYAPAASTYSSGPYVQTEQGASGWLTIKNGWRLLDDRLGIEVTVPDPEEWTTGNPKLPKIAGISQVATAGTNNWQPFTLRLTTTIESDLRIDARAEADRLADAVRPMAIRRRRRPLPVHDDHAGLDQLPGGRRRRHESRRGPRRHGGRDDTCPAAPQFARDAAAGRLGDHPGNLRRLLDR